MSGSDAERGAVGHGALGFGPLGVVSMRLGMLLAVMLLPALLYLPTTVSLIAEWEDTDALTYTHGYLVAALSLWLLYRKRHELVAAQARPSILAFGLLAMASILWLVLYQAGIQVGHQALFPLIVWLGVLAAFGWPIARLSAFPVGYLYFAIPVWNLANGAIQALSVYAVRGLLRVAGVPAYFEGNFVHIPSGVFEIAGGCSGLHFLIVALALAALGGEVSRDTWRIRLLMVALAGGLSIIGNWFRIFTIIVAGHLTDMQHYLIREDHYYFGWGVFAVVMTVYFLIVRRLPASPDVPPPIHAGVAREPVARAVFAGVAAAIAVLAVGPAWGLVIRSAVPPPTNVALPAITAAWSGPVAGPVEWQPRFVGADSQESGSYRGVAGTVDVFVATYLRQAQGRELIGYDNSVIGPGPWQTLSTARLEWRGIPVNESLVSRDDGTEFLLWFTYGIGDRHFARGVATQLWYGLVSLGGVPDSRVVALRTECNPGCQDARATLNEFLEQSGLLAGPTAVQREFH